MGSNTVAAFLAKLLRPDKKDKSKQQHDAKKRRHSAPVPDWIDVSAVTNTSSQKQQKLQQSKKAQEKAKPTTEQQANKAKKRQSTSAKNRKGNSKGSNPALYWFCMSGNVDTLERTPLPSLETSKTSNQGNRVSGGSKGKENDVPEWIDFMRGGDRKKKKDMKNRHSAPVPGWFSVHKPNDARDLESADGSQNVQRQRELSPGVRYRYDGTLERPYVFPAGLTFGPEGRKTQLRRSTPKEDKSQAGRRRNKQTVKADVHSSRDDVIVEYYEEGETAGSQDEFDVRKAFYLKYDSNMSPSEQRTAYRYSMPVVSDAFDVAEEHNQHRFHSRDDETKISRHSNSSDTENKKHDKRGRSRNRYSMPPKNDDFVYMGSFENLQMSESSGKSAVFTDERSSKREKKNRRNRYSMPVKNSDLVFMGSLENLNKLLVSDDNKKGGLSVPEMCHNNADLRSGQHRSHNNTDDVKQKDLRVTHNSPGVYGGNEINYGVTVHDQDGTLRTTSWHRSSQRSSIHRHSLPELSFQNQLSVARSTKSEGQSDAEYASEEEDDFFDDKLPVGRGGKFTSPSPFSRNTGRSSCMPGNKRSIPPPPCINASVDNSNSTTIFSGVTSYIPGTRTFNIPPPPTYTPPKEEMERVQAQIFHKGSQTDLSADFTSLNMEDRDMSLKRTDAKTIFAAISTLPQTEAEINHSENPITYDRPDSKVQSKDSPLVTLQSNFADISQGSDEVFAYPSLSESITSTTLTDVQESADRRPIDEHQDADESPLVSFNSFLPQTKFTNVETTLKEAVEETVEQKPHKPSTDKACDDSNDKVAVTSTPKTVRRPRHTRQTNPGAHDSSSERPVPSPRKRYSTLGLVNTSTTSNEAAGANDKEPKSPPNNRTPPIPKKRRNLSRSQSSSVSSQPSAQKSHEFTVSPGFRSIEGTHSSDKEGITERQASKNPYDNAKDCSHYQDSDDDENIYEEIDNNIFESNTVHQNDEHIYDECGEGINATDNSCPTDILPPLKEMKLPSSPRPRRRLCDRAMSSVEGMSLSQRPFYTGLSSSFVDLVDFSNNIGGRSMFDERSETLRRRVLDTHDDDNCIADDEMSGSNDDTIDDMDKRGSLRKCVSADDLLRSGSIVDRSMIMARKRRHRMRERKCKSHMFSSTDTDYGADSHLASTRHPQYSYQRQRNNCGDRGHSSRQKHSHNDSGHDSDMISPCTSPDAKRLLDNAKRLLDNMARRYEEDPRFDDGLETCEQRQGTLTKKPWEIRLWDKQMLRKSRSRENLSASTSRLDRISKSKFETDV